MSSSICVSLHLPVCYWKMKKKQALLNEQNHNLIVWESLPHSCVFPFIGSNSWRPYEWMTSIMPCPQQPCSTPVDSCLCILYRASASPMHFSSFPAAFCFCQHLLLVSKNPAFSRCAQNKTASVLSFLSLAMFQGLFALRPTCLLFSWSRVSTELSSKTIFQIFFLLISLFTFQLLHRHTVIESMRM